MNKLLWSPIAAKHRASQAGVLPPGAKQLASELPRAVDVRARPNRTGPAPSSPRTLPARPGVLLLWQFASQNCLAIRLRIALDNLATLLHE